MLFITFQQAELTSLKGSLLNHEFWKTLVIAGDVCRTTRPSTPLHCAHMTAVHQATIATTPTR